MLESREEKIWTTNSLPAAPTRIMVDGQTEPISQR